MVGETYVQGPENAMRRRSASVVDAARANMRATELALDVGAALSPIFRHHMRQAVARQRVMQEGVARREMARLAVGFVDLVGSTGMQAGLDPDELGDVVNRFEATAFDVVIAGGGRLVKFIGDAIMFPAVEPVAGCRIVADLISAFTAGGTLPRGGLVFGEVLFRHSTTTGPWSTWPPGWSTRRSRARCWPTLRSSTRSTVTSPGSTRPVGACSRASPNRSGSGPW